MQPSSSTPSTSAVGVSMQPSSSTPEATMQTPSASTAEVWLAFHTVTFYHDVINTRVTNDPSEVERWINVMEYIHQGNLHKLVVGLDLEWRPNLTGDRAQDNPVALIQLCVGHQCLIFQVLWASSVPDSLRTFMGNPRYTFVGVGIAEDARKLRSTYWLNIEHIVDLRTRAFSMFRDERFFSVSLKDLAEIVLHKVLEKPMEVTLSRWDNKRLSFSQVKYACLDAFVCFELGRYLRASVN
ncbi:Werner Syndrome-like exonuclease [Punica granatum]|uniref:Werner Syndrome-like exonuclease n=1 Tax=Punica granatum TaxID=22663 RepID=A0A218WKW5_PUNGR|nr:Werner Syndrome-like exonuclease [Punica granatum]OWM73109.1 hypothetical protein CDL15_Pgr001223 [Punica granatum]